MYIGTSIFLFALGAILKFAVTATVAGFSIQTAGVILMVVGIVGLIASFLFLAAAGNRRRGDVVVEERPVEREYRR